MIRLTRPQLILVISAGLLILTLVILVWPREETKWVITPPAVSYLPEALPEAGTVNPDFTEYLNTGRNPFIPARGKLEIQARLELPPLVIKKPRFSLLFPRPDSRYCQELLFPLPLDKLEYRYDEIQRISLPLTETLLSLEQLNLFVAEIIELATAPPVEEEPVDPFRDRIIFNDNTSIKGKIISVDKEKVVFHQEGKKYFITFYQKEIARIVPFFTPEEIYEQKAKQVPPDNTNAHYKLAQWCLKEGLEKQAAVQIEQVIEIDDTKLDFYLFAAQLYRQQMELTKELTLYKKALASPLVKKEIIQVELGELYCILNLPGQALKAFESAVRTYPRYIEGWIKLGEAHYKNGDYKLASEAYKRAQEIDPANPSFIYGFGMLAFSKGEFNQAKTELLKVIKKLPDRKSKLLNALGVIAVNLQEYSDGVKYFQEAIKADLDTAQHWVNLAFMYLITEQYDETGLLLDQAAQRDPTSALPYLGQGYLAWLQDKLDEATATFQAGLRIEPEHSLIHYALAQLYFAQGDQEQAQAGFMKCLKFNSPVIGSLYYLGLVSFQENDFTQAATYFDVYLKKYSKPDMADYTMAGIIHLAVKQWAAARQLFETAHNINPHYTPALNGLAYLNFATRQIKTATEQFEEVLKHTPDDPYARDSLEAIKLAAIQTVWEDNFHRDDSKTIGEGWLEDESCGIEIELVNQQLQFSGEQRIKEQGFTFLERAIARASFIRLEVELNIKYINKAGCGIYLSAQTRRRGQRKEGLLLGVVNNQLVYQISSMAGGAPAKWEILSNDISSGLVRLSIVRAISSGPRKGNEFRLYLDKTCATTIPATKLRSFNATDTWSVGIFGYASVKEAWELIVNQVRIYEKKPEEKPR